MHPVSQSEPASAEAPRAHLQLPVNVRSLSLVILATIASLLALRVASPVFIPLMLGVMLSYALSPLVDRLERLRVPRALGAAVLIGAIGAGFGWTAYSLSDDAAALIESLPAAAQKVRESVHARRGHATAIDQMQRAAADLEQAAQEGAAAAPASSRGVTRVSIERARFDIKDYLWTGTLGAAAALGQALVVVFIAYFVMASGSSFRRKVVKIAGPTFARRRITVEVLDKISEQIHRYLLAQVFTSLLVGLATWLAFLGLGLQHAAVWGVAAFVLNFVPYLGSIAIAVGAGLVAFVQFGTLNMVLAVAGVAMIIHGLSGQLLTPWLTSRTNRLNAVTVFVGVLAFGWLWGVWGLLLGVPLLTTLKAVCDRVDDLRPIGEMLGH
ncbi:MAG: AI-2E family transporter [Burkholderiales bacterium]|nr:AI-2E family transporter [Burkholderiales bacterium]MDE2276112.1 AI-2E family transporter [Burkholderiales bacterium]